MGGVLFELGIPVIDTDNVVHELLTNPGPVRTAVIDQFGSEIRTDSGAIDRDKLGKIVFADARSRRQLEQIVHPAVLLECRRRVAELSSFSNVPIIAVLVPLLFEAGIESEYDQIWCVVAEEKILRERLFARLSKHGGSAEEMEQRLQAQMPQEQKAARADQIIDNSGTLDATRKQVEVLLQKLGWE